MTLLAQQLSILINAEASASASLSLSHTSRLSEDFFSARFFLGQPANSKVMQFNDWIDLRPHQTEKKTIFHDTIGDPPYHPLI